MLFELQPEVQYELNRVLENAYNGVQVDFDALCDRLKAKVYNVKFADPNVSGSVRLEENGSFSIYLNNKHSLNRKRFTLAHELGHIISHNANSFSKEKLEEEGYVERRKPLVKVTDIAETEANEIAANILMPAVLLESWISKCENPSVEYLANIFGVSCDAMSVRLSRLGYTLI